MQHIEASAFRKGEYVGYAAGVWRIRRRPSGHGWYAASRDNASAPFLFGRTLAALDAALEAHARAKA